MQIRNHIFPLHIVVKLFPRQGGINTRLLTAILIISACQFASLLLTTYLEGTLWLPGVGKGLLEHYGVWAIITTDPLLVISTGYAYRLFRKIMTTIPVKGEPDRKDIRKNILKGKIDFILLADQRGQYVYALLLIVGTIAWTNNLVQTCAPVQYYGNDVFDASHYLYGFLANKANLFLSWVVVYPIVAFFSLSMSVSVFLMLREMKAKGMLVAQLHHPDRCFGYSSLGSLNIVLMLPYFLTYEVMFFLAATHENSYLSLIIPLVAVTIFFLSASYITIYPLSSFINKENLKQKGNVQKNLQIARFNDRLPSIRLVLDSLYLAMMHRSPYSSNAKSFVVTLRMVTISMTIYKALFPTA